MSLLFFRFSTVGAALPRCHVSSATDRPSWTQVKQLSRRRDSTLLLSVAAQICLCKCAGPAAARLAKVFRPLYNRQGSQDTHTHTRTHTCTCMHALTGWCRQNQARLFYGLARSGMHAMHITHQTHTHTHARTKAALQPLWCFCNQSHFWGVSLSTWAEKHIKV